MRAPEFWHEPPGLAAKLLAPVGAAWDIAARLRRAVARPYRAPVPVLCVGNLVAGGSGKTPVVLSLAGILAERAAAVHVVSRGYGGSSKPHDPKEYSLKSRADDTIAVLDKEGISTACCLGGSIGAAILMDDGTIVTGEELVAREKNGAPGEHLLWSNDSRIWRPFNSRSHYTGP